jgi:diguanylate cyclase (GGDEF)-like protein
MTTASWATQELAEFLEIFGAIERAPMLELAIDRVAEAFDAEVSALVSGTEVSVCRGFPPDQVPTDQLIELRSSRPCEVRLPCLGSGHILTADVDTDTDTHLVVVRHSESFTREESTLMRSMGRALGLANANGVLLTQLAERQELAERLFRIEQSISHRAPLQDVLDAVTDGAAELLGANIVAIHVDLDTSADNSESDDHYASVRGVTGKWREVFAATPVGAGFVGRAYLEDRLVVTDDYRCEPDRADTTGSYGTRAAMAAPVHRQGHPVGVLSVASRDPARRFTSAEQEVLLTFAQHVSLALNDASAVNDLRRSLEGATYRASHDSLTGLLNRSAVLDALSDLLDSAAQSAPIAVIFMDVDRFKGINDLLGHGVGDRVLIEIADRLRASVRSGDVVARLSGDEFVVLAPGISVSEAEAMSERISETVALPIEVDERDVLLTISVGLAMTTIPLPADDLLANADVAMYRAKQRGRARVVHFDHQMRVEMMRHSELERGLTVAIRDPGQLVVHYQPLYRLGTGRIDGFEALVRWQHPHLGMLSAGEFVPVAEDTGQVAALGRFVLAEAVRELTSWRTMGEEFEHLSMAVNLSARQFADPNLVMLVDEVLRNHELPPEMLRFEITETTLMEETSTTDATVAGLRDLAIGLSIDDFGTGYSSLTYLKRFPIDTLKIDREFVSGLCMDSDDEAIVTAVIALADALGLTTVAEGVERKDQLEWLGARGCTLAQGYLLGRPIDAASTRELLRASLVTTAEHG